MNPTKVRSSLLTLTLILTLVACGSPSQPEPEPEPGPTIAGAIDNIAGMPMPISITLFTARSSAFGSAGIHMAAPTVHEYEGQYLDLATALVSPGGTFELALPDGDEIPGAYLVPAASVIQSPPNFPDSHCSLSADAAANVLRVWLPPEAAVGFPIIIAGPISPDLSHALGILAYTDGDFLAPAGPLKVRSWVHASADVGVQGECVTDDGNDPPVTYATVDLSLEAGWNEITLHFDPAENMMEVSTEGFSGAWLFLGAVGP